MTITLLVRLLYIGLPP